MNKQDTKKAMQSAAKAFGFELVYSDLRSGCFHIKKGQIVRMGFVWKNIDKDGITDQFKTVSQYGQRLDTMQGSKYSINTI